MVAAAQKPAASCRSVRSASAPSSAPRPKNFSPTASSARSPSSKARSAATTPPAPGISAARSFSRKSRLDTWQGTVPKVAFNPNIFARWRCWKEYGTGLAGDLLVHLVSGMNYMLGWNEPPKRAMALGDILRFKDGRNMPDVHATLSITAARRLSPPQSRLRNAGNLSLSGLQGVLEVTEFTIAYLPQSGEDESPSYYTPLSASDARCLSQEMAPGPRSQAGKEPSPKASTIVALLGRGKTAPMEILPGRAKPSASH